MNASAERHLTRAEGYFGKGEEWYRKAALEIVAAKEADNSLSNRQIGERFDRSPSWVATLVTWITSEPDPGTMPNTIDTPRRMQNQVRTALAKAPIEEIEAIVEQLPAERRHAIARATTTNKLPEPPKETRRTGDSLYIHTAGDLVGARRKVRQALSAIRAGEDLDDEHKELLLDAVEKLKLDLDLMVLVLEGGSVDWDAEFAKLGEA